MRQILPLILLLASCASTIKSAAPVQAPPSAPMTTNKSAKLDPVEVAAAQDVLMFMVAQLDLDLAGAMAMCSAAGDKLLPMEGKDHWFNCGGPEGYTVTVDDDGKVLYCMAVGQEYEWTLPVLREVLGREDKMEISDTMAETHWYRQPADKDDHDPDLDISFVVPKDKTVHPFVSMQFVKSGTLSL